MNRLVRKRVLRHRYTIAEMIMVAGIFIIILSMAMAAWLNSGSEAKLKRAARMVNDQLNLARSKAIAERTEVGVFFYFDAAKNQKCGLYYYDGTTRGKAVVGESELPFPAGTIATYIAIPKQTKDYTINPVNIFITFNAKGQVSQYKYNVSSNLTTATDNNSYNEPLRSIWIATAQKQKNNSLRVALEDAYYEVAVNTFNGRTKTTYHEVNN